MNLDEDVFGNSGPTTITEDCGEAPLLGKITIKVSESVHSSANQEVARLYDQRKRGAMKFVYSRGIKDPQIAEDLVQNSFLKLLQYRGRPAQELGPLFATILENMVCSYFRKANTRYERFSTSTTTIDGGNMLDYLHDGNSNNPELLAELGQDMEALRTIVDGLPLKQGQVFERFHIDNITGKGVAQILGCHVGTVKTHSARVREKIRGLGWAALDDALSNTGGYYQENPSKKRPG